MKWLGAEAQRLVVDAVRDVEARSAAEIVVTVRATSSTYRHVDVAFGAAMGALVLVAYVYLPIVFPDDIAVPAVLCAFGGGFALSWALTPLKRALSSRATRRRAVALAARAAFVDQAIHSTRARTGILIYVSLFEREVEIVVDRGIPQSAGLEEALARLASESARAPEALASALRRLGDVLAETCPRGAEDVNELPDAVVA